MAAGKLIASDCTVSIALGGAVTPSGPSWPGGSPFNSPTAVTYLLKRATLEEGVKDVDVSAIGDGLDKYRPQRINFELTIEIELDAGRTALFTSAQVGYYIAVQFKAYSGYSTNQQFVGYISKRSNEVSDGDAQMEKITVKGGVDGYTYTLTYA